LAAMLLERDWPARPGLSEASQGVIGYLERNAHRMEYPEYVAHGWRIGSGAVESARKSVAGERLKLAGINRPHCMPISRSPQSARPSRSYLRRIRGRAFAPTDRSDDGPSRPRRSQVRVTEARSV
jgi:hypothetical protein